MVPEEGHLLFQRPFRIHQVIKPVDVPHWRLTTGQQRGRLVAQQAVGVDRRLGLRMQQLLDRGLIPLGHPCFEFVTGSSEARPTHQVSHQTDVFLICHSLALLPLGDRLYCVSLQAGATGRTCGGWLASRHPKQAISLPEAVTTSSVSQFTRYAIRPSMLWERAVAKVRPGRLNKIKIQART